MPADQLVRIPQASGDAAADAKSWGEFWSRLGRPETADKYTAPAKLPDGFKGNEERQKGFFAKAHELGLTQKQAEGLYGWDAENVMAFGKQQLDAAEAKLTEAGKALQQRWGTAFQEKLGLANEAVKHLGDKFGLSKELVGELQATNLGNHPALAEVFHYVGTLLKEDGTLVGRGSGGKGGALSPAEAKQEIAAKYRDGAFMKVYGDRTAPGHQEAVKTMEALFAQAHPPEGAAA